MHEFFRRVRYVLSRHRLDRELADEMAFHREMAARDGAMPFGNALRLREEAPRAGSVLVQPPLPGGRVLPRPARDREIAIRAAVGASSARLIRQLFTESLLLAVLGSAAAVVLGQLVLQMVMALTGAPSWLDPTPDWRVLAFAIAMASVTATLFGLAPALQIARRRQRSPLMRQILIGAQVAASCVLLIVAGLLVRALDRVSSAHPGFDYQQVLAINPHFRRSTASWSGHEVRDPGRQLTITL